MTDPAKKIVKVFTPLPDDAIIYRGLRNKWVNTDEDDVKLDQEAFRLRKDEKAISVNISASSAKDLAILRKWHNVASLCVKDIRALGLDVIQDSTTHAGITDLYGQTDLQAERLASLLATQSTIISIEDI
jgi:hypothetical protein